MQTDITLLRRFLTDESGATAIEYGLIAGLIAVAIITALGLLGDNISAALTKNATEGDGDSAPLGSREVSPR